MKKKLKQASKTNKLRLKQLEEEKVELETDLDEKAKEVLEKK